MSDGPVVLVCGGRTFSDSLTLVRELQRLHPRAIIVGGANGADTLASRYAESCGIPLIVFPALWDTFGKAAGPKRNGWMLEFGKPDVVLAMPGGRGTENMVRQAEANNVKVIRG